MVATEPVALPLSVKVTPVSESTVPEILYVDAGVVPDIVLPMKLTAATLDAPRFTAVLIGENVYPVKLGVTT